MSDLSFSGSAKAELSRAALTRECCAVAEAYGVLLYANCFTAREIRIITASPDFAQRLPRLWRRAFDFDFDAVRAGGGAARSILTITAPEKIRTVFNRFGYDPEAMLSHHTAWNCWPSWQRMTEPSAADIGRSRFLGVGHSG